MDVYRALWRHRFIIVILTAALTAVAYYVAASEKKVYTARTLIRIQQKVTDPAQAYTSLAVGQQLAKTYAKIVTTRSIRDRVSVALGNRVPESEIDIGAAPVEDLALLSISATSHDPRVASAVANAAPGVLRAFISETQTINDQIVTISPARVPTYPTSPKPTRIAILALIIGLIFNGGLALLIEFFRDRLPDLEEIEKVFGKPVLGTIPVLNFRSTTTDRPEPELERIGGAKTVPAGVEGVELIRRPGARRKQGVEGVG